MSNHPFKFNPQNLPDTPGVYFFYNQQNKLLYIGKATSLKNRVSSYFRGVSHSSRPVEQLIAEVTKIKFQLTNSVLEAIILESNLIKKYQPPYNVDGKDDKSGQYICLTKDEYPQIKLIRAHELTQHNQTKWLKIFGPYDKGLNLKIGLKIMRDIFHYSTCTPNSERPCLYYQMGKCTGVCTGEISPKQYKTKVITPLILFLQGKSKELLLQLNKNLRQAAKNEDFEEAGRLRDEINALIYIKDIALINKTFFEFPRVENAMNYRIEGYDISHLGGKEVVGSLVVFNANEAQKQYYRRFKLKINPRNDDTGSLREIITRRLNHHEWALPDIFLIDGGVGQVATIREMLKNKQINKPIIGISKGRQRKNNDFWVNVPIGYTMTQGEALQKFIATHRLLFIQVRDEAHRFAITYQKKLRRLS